RPEEIPPQHAETQQQSSHVVQLPAVHVGSQLRVRSNSGGGDGEKRNADVQGSDEEEASCQRAVPVGIERHDEIERLEREHARERDEHRCRKTSLTLLTDSYFGIEAAPVARESPAKRRPDRGARRQPLAHVWPERRIDVGEAGRGEQEKAEG